MKSWDYDYSLCFEIINFKFYDKFAFGILETRSKQVCAYLDVLHFFISKTNHFRFNYHEILIKSTESENV